MSRMIDLGVSRRAFLQVAGTAAAGLAVSVAGARGVGAQEATRTTTGAPMDQDAYKPVQLPPKADATPKVSDAERDEMEHHLHCQCGCGLDVFTCRTTDFSCSVSPAMHADVMGLVAGGYTVKEIMQAFRDVYGERVYMSPVKEGFNWVGYLAPFGALAGGAVLVSVLLKRWSRPSAHPAGHAAGHPTAPSSSDATPDELARVRDALRSDE